jgi:hypothetical protein
MNIFLIVKSTELTQHKMSLQTSGDFGIAVMAFIAFILLVYLVLSPTKPKKIKNERTKFLL